MKSNARIAGGLILLSFITGLLSVSPGVDSADYLTEAAGQSNQTIAAALYQFILAIIYVGIALLFFPVFSKLNKMLAVSFLGFRIIATTLMLVGTVLLLSILVLSQGYVNHPTSDTHTLHIIGNMLRYSRDYFNHVFMVLVLGISNLIAYYIFFRSRLIPSWISIWGMVGTLLSMTASVLLMFQVFDVITTEYLILNTPTAIVELLLGFWLIIKGWNTRDLPFAHE
ncbi:DUF4386 domain-containing protein [Phaeocystidibacter marisrubri]|uniref:DUF4386 domain-containing protein n=1 Tax=Phaeocystidibacter marisrubri TaxID=1577780 RepID=A0A6L3ZDV3_9FLAO|nr:DUF4386 domain-containing protein [Phaeocystidibacter marisrubri]KAB2815617.1 DUF4386 domain-containing protein [Phaeocystidibacter marisrubri]